MTRARPSCEILTPLISFSLCLSTALTTGPALAGSSVPVAPSRLSRSSPAKSGTEHLTGTVTQTGAQRLDRTTGQSPAGNADNSGGSLFSPGDINAFSTASPPASTAPPPVQTISQPVQATAPANTSQGGGAKRALELGLGLASQIGITLSQSPAARDVVKGALSAAFSHHAAPAKAAGAPTALSSGLSNLSKMAGKSFVGHTLTKQELNLLSHYDVVVVIDKSGSMNETDCPGGSSRWDWCRDQLLNFTSQTASVFKDGITVVLFSSNYREFNNVDFSLIPQIFSSNSPGGGTYMAKPLSQIFDEYFQKRDSSPSPVRKLLIEVITDGDPSDRGDLFETVSRATQKMKSADEVKLNFLQIGNERAGTNTLSKLSTELVPNDGAQFDIVGLEPFSLIETEGLPRAMVDAASK